MSGGKKNIGRKYKMRIENAVGYRIKKQLCETGADLGVGP